MLPEIKKHIGTVEVCNGVLEHDKIILIENGKVEAEFSEETATIKITSNEGTMSVKIIFNTVK